MPRVVRAALIQASNDEPVDSPLETIKKAMIDKHIELIAAAASQGAQVCCLQEQAAAAAALSAPPEVAAMEAEEGYDELIDIDRVEGRVRASSVKKVGEIVEKHPEEALSIIRNWLYQEG